MEKRISFDLDDTLFCSARVPTEPNCVPWLFRRWFPERLRLGTRQLMRRLVEDGWKISIYTTSHRSVGYIRSLFSFYRIDLDLIVNQRRHEKVIGKNPTKHPKEFGITLHVDDSDGVAAEGRQFNFATAIVKPTDENWIEIVIDAANHFVISDDNRSRD